MYPDLPYETYTWPLTQHMGRITKKNLYGLLYAAALYSKSPDPSPRINEYAIVNKLFPSNIRTDSGQSEIWRDYQQLLCELGLIVSTTIDKTITLTPLGLAHLDGTVGYDDLMRVQAFRYQYPNGNKATLDSEERAKLTRNKQTEFDDLIKLQIGTGVLVRPAVLCWDILGFLSANKQEPILTIDEMTRYVIRCTKNDQAESAAEWIARSRNTKTDLPSIEITKKNARRNAQDWFKFLSYTKVFEKQNDKLRIASDALISMNELNSACLVLRDPRSFWIPSPSDSNARLRWFLWFGNIDFSSESLFGIGGRQASVRQQDFRGGDENEVTPDRDLQFASTQEITLKNWLPDQGEGPSDGVIGPRIGVYSVDVQASSEKWRLHDTMVSRVATVAHNHGAEVWYDPGSVDLLLSFENQEFLVEVKTAIPKNFVQRLRLALGQLLHYDYLRSKVSRNRVLVTRKTVAFPLHIPNDHWSVAFLNGHLDFDMISLDSDLVVHTTNDSTRRLFAS